MITAGTDTCALLQLLRTKPKEKILTIAEGNGHLQRTTMYANSWLVNNGSQSGWTHVLKELKN